VAVAVFGLVRPASADEDAMGVFRSKGQIAVRAPVFCTDSMLNDQLRQDNVVVTADVPGSGKLAPGRIVGLRMAEPDDLPMEISMLVPRDRTMQNAHDKLMEMVGTTGALLASLGHRNHVVRLFTYHACQDENHNTAGNAVVEDRGSYPTSGDGPTRLREVATEIRRASGLCKPAEFKQVVDGFLQASATPAGKEELVQRTRILIVVHDGMEVAQELRTIQNGAPSAPAAELASALAARFQRVLLIEPDIAPTVLKRYSPQLLKLGAVREHIVDLYVDEIMGECTSQLGSAADACVSAEAVSRRKKQAEALAGAVGQVQLTSSLGETFVSRSSLVALAAGAGVRKDSNRWAVTEKQVNAAFPRPQGLDCFGSYLASEGLGALVLFGGLQSNRPVCKGFDVQPPSVASSLADALLRSSPFNGARIAEVCFGSVPTEPTGTASEARYDVSIKQPEGNQLRCASGKLKLPQAAAAAATGTAAATASPDSDRIVASICRPPEEKAPASGGAAVAVASDRTFSLFFVIVVGLACVVSGLGLAAVFGRKRDD
jgi:hypothetical protein